MIERTERTERTEQLPRILLACVSLAHVLVYWLVVFVLFLIEVNDQAIAMGILLGQCSLATVVCTTRKGWWPIRMGLPWVVGALCWYGMWTVLLWGLGDNVIAWWAIAIVVQVFATIIGLRVVDSRGYLEQPNGQSKTANEDLAEHATPGSFQSDGNEAAGISGAGISTPIQFPIRTLILLTTLAAIGFAVISYGQRIGLWSVDAIIHIDVLLMGAIGCALALTTVCVVLALSPARIGSVIARLLAVFVLVAVLGISLMWGAIVIGVADSMDQQMIITILFAILFPHTITVAVSLFVTERLPRILDW